MTFFDILRSQVIILEESVLLLNKAQSEKKFYAFNAVLRVDANDVKLFIKLQEGYQLIISMIRNLC